MRRLSSLLLLFGIAFLLFICTIPLHEGVHYLCDLFPGSGVEPIQFNFFNDNAFRSYSIASVSVRVYDQQVARTTYIIGEILGFTVQFIIVAVILLMAIRREKIANFFNI